jgi:hypothetical protein
MVAAQAKCVDTDSMRGQLCCVCHTMCMTHTPSIRAGAISTPDESLSVLTPPTPPGAALHVPVLVAPLPTLRPGYNIPANTCDTDAGSSVVFTAAAPLGLSGVRPTARPSAVGSYRCYATGPPQNRPCTTWSLPGGSTWAAPCNVTTVAELSAPAGAVLAAAVTYADGRETLAIALEW